MADEKPRKSSVHNFSLKSQSSMQGRSKKTGKKQTMMSEDGLSAQKARDTVRARAQKAAASVTR
jgi:hypothetical protein